MITCLNLFVGLEIKRIPWFKTLILLSPQDTYHLFLLAEGNVDLSDHHPEQVAWYFLQAVTTSMIALLHQT
jgi:hypothetical protein